jgi:hypothetical protein
MDGTNKARRKRWIKRAEAAFERMFEGKGEEELVTLTQRENMAVLIAKELAAFLLEEHVARDCAAQPKEASMACCPKCGQPGAPSRKEGAELGERAVTTRVGRIRMQRQRWECPKCRIAFFPAGRSTGLGDGRL